jgi:hypothetical protein
MVGVRGYVRAVTCRLGRAAAFLGRAAGPSVVGLKGQFSSFSTSWLARYGREGYLDILWIF